MEESETGSSAGGDWSASEAPRCLLLDIEEAGDLSRKRSSNVLVLGLDCVSLLAWREWDRGVPGLEEGLEFPRAGAWGDEGLGDEYGEIGRGVPERKIDGPAITWCWRSNRWSRIVASIVNMSLLLSGILADLLLGYSP